MDNIPISLENILEQAPRWTFAGDFTLLQWMKQISQDLESRATKTAEALAKLDNNVKSTNIALDNVANRLTTLQFGNQFVECRVQDDDETLLNANEDCVKENPAEEISSEELLNTFLNNNLKVLRNCHEKYSIDLEDSDDEENSKEKTCIYQPINPYNDRPLPYIFGSKDWHSKWHVGLYENQQDNSYSGDELSEAFSESSSTSHVDDNESFESNTEWASSNSINNDHLNANIEVKNASSLQGSQPLYPGTPLPITNAKTTTSESSSISTTSSLLAKQSMQTTKQNENLTQRSESINSISSKNSSKTIAKVILDTKENILHHKMQTQRFEDLFAEPPEDPESATSSSVSSASNIATALDDNRTIKKESPLGFKTQPPPFMDLFAETPENNIPSVTSSMLSNQITKRKSINLFDDDGGKASNDDFLSVLSKDNELDKNVSKEHSPITNKSSMVVKTGKSLFDDSDDDDDFLKAFVKKSSPKQSTTSSLAKTLLFDDEIHTPSILAKSKLPHSNRDSTANASSFNASSEEKSLNIFDDTEDDSLFTKSKAKDTKIPIQSPKMVDVSQPTNTSAPVTNLLNELENNSVNKFNDLKNTDSLTSDVMAKKVNLFDDVDEADDSFSTKTKNNEEPLQEKTTTKDAADEIGDNQSSVTKKGVDANIITENNNFVNREEYCTIAEERTSKISKHEVDNNKLSELPIQENYTQPHEGLNINKFASTTTEKLEPMHENASEKPNSSNKYDFNSVLFSEEPPDDDDDDEFFETLTKTSSALNSNYNTIDLENDIYEPELPKVPATNIGNNQTDTIDNFYTGLQLFSDIPPDDDVGSSATSIHVLDVNQTKRLHSVFYDDFNETLMALNQQNTENTIPKHSVFSDEPPPMNAMPISFSADVTDHKVPDDKEKIINVDHKTKTDDKSDSEFLNRRPVAKLQMPNININIEALLPGASTTLRKAKKDNLKSEEANVDTVIPKGFVVENQAAISKPLIRETLRTAETQHILSNVTKNRVKGPAARRPSTRIARQENYRKSLVEQQQSWPSGYESENENTNVNETTKTYTKIFIPQGSPLKKESKNSPEDQRHKFKGKFNNNASNPTSSGSKVFEEKHQDDSKFLQENTKNNDKLPNNSKEIKVKTKTKHETPPLLFDAEDEDDDDFFTHIKTSNILDSNKSKKIKENTEYKARKSSLGGDEGNAVNSLLLITDGTDNEISKETTSLQSQSSSAANTNEVASTPTSAKEYEKNKTTQVIETTNLKTPNQLKTNQLTSFLDSEDDENDLFKGTAQQPTSSTRNMEKNIKAKALFKSFLDSETDEECNTLEKKFTSTELPKAPIQAPKISNAKIFSDSETDSDDLFGKRSATKTSNKKASTKSAIKPKPPVQSSLFNSGESDGGDFLSSSGSIGKITTPKNVLKKNVAKAITRTNTSLFSDLDSDEDDLFGGETAKAATTSAANTKNVKTPSTYKRTGSISEISKSKVADDNPLADLL